VLEHRIVLVDGKALVQMMISHGVGVQVEHAFILNRVDEDFFDSL